MSSCQILLVAHCWPRRFWFNDLLGLLFDCSRKLPHRSDVLYQRGRLHADSDMFHYTSGRYWAIPTGETFFCYSFNPRFLCKEKVHQNSL
ncbi:hypothetical protein DPMN_030720 [Dreissena polymorpha]|uniref:Uncharacterized protein n=1 Tax=Dreissena polymorpha TaxID=45954 RepID=A0A9D4M1A8_DREPO|nr:hypothetical protein DPMN_030720 [Dreissena polymorpha]